MKKFLEYNVIECTNNNLILCVDAKNKLIK